MRYGFFCFLLLSSSCCMAMDPPPEFTSEETNELIRSIISPFSLDQQNTMHKEDTQANILADLKLRKSNAYITLSVDRETAHNSILLLREKNPHAYISLENT
jgi:hypothetical protein